LTAHSEFALSHSGAPVAVARAQRSRLIWPFNATNHLSKGAARRRDT
jgi:hypothetical protein